jgi:hypothetical protein
MSTVQILVRGFVAAHAALIGAVYLFLLHAPGQVLAAVLQSFQRKMFAKPAQEIDPVQTLLLMALGGLSLAFSLALCFLYPLVQGGILGQVRDRIEYPDRNPGQLGAYGRRYYARLLGCLGLFILITVVLMLPMIAVSMGIAIQMMAQVEALGSSVDEAAPPPTLDTRQLFSYPLMVAVTIVTSLLVSAAGLVYWLACSMVVVEQERVLTAWKKALTFSRRNLPGVLAVWLTISVVGFVLMPLGMVGPLGIVSAPGILVPLALVYAAGIGYVGVLTAGLVMSLYLARRNEARKPEPELAAV